jgi:hypothetical protein
MLSFSWRRCASVGTAEDGTLPGSDKVVFAWQANAKEQRMSYKMLREGGMPPVLPSSVMVKAEYPNKSQTINAMIVPAGSERLSQIPCSSVVPTLHDQDMSLKLSL